jgi:hypothetical protein
MKHSRWSGGSALSACWIAVRLTAVSAGSASADVSSGLGDASSDRLAHGRRLPRNLMPFLDDCHRLGLLRAVGPI